MSSTWRVNGYSCAIEYSAGNERASVQGRVHGAGDIPGVPSHRHQISSLLAKNNGACWAAGERGGGGMGTGRGGCNKTGSAYRSVGHIISLKCLEPGRVEGGGEAANTIHHGGVCWKDRRRVTA